MKLLLIIISFFLLLPCINGYIDCYDCQNCQIPFNDQTNTMSCSNGVTQCLKITAKLGTVYTYVSKQCGPCSNLTYLFGVTYLQVDCCTGTKCNDGHRLYLSHSFLLLGFVFLISFYLNKNI